MCDIADSINIMDVVKKNNIRITGRSGISHRATCPFCGGKSTLSITPQKNLFQCFLCGASGNTVKLEYMLNPTEYTENSYPTFLKNMEAYLCSGISISPEYEYHPIENFEDSTQRASDEQCSSVYISMLSMLGLKEAHKQDLLKRGLTEDEIRTWKIKSAPTGDEKYSIPRRLQKMGHDLKGVPGFYLEKNNYVVKTPKGYLCPVYDGYRSQILGFQTRLDNPIDGNKYTWFSSVGKPNGASSGALASILPGKYDKTALIVEGTLKGLITYILLNRELTVITTPGVTSIKCLEESLDSYAGKMLFLAFDMDQFLTFDPKNAKTDDDKKLIKKSKDIKKAIAKLEQKCKDFGVETHGLKWNVSDDGLWSGQEKGIDDFLLSYKDRQKFVDYVKGKNERFLRMTSVLH